MPDDTSKPYGSEHGETNTRLREIADLLEGLLEGHTEECTDDHEEKRGELRLVLRILEDSRKLAIAEKALRFYAESQRYIPNNPRSHTQHECIQEQDKGVVARAALAEIEKPTTPKD